MDQQTDVTKLAADVAQALVLLKASHALYRDMLSAVGDSVSADGTADVEALCTRFNAALTGFAPRDMEIRRLMARFGGEA